MCIPAHSTINQADTTFLTPQRIQEMRQASKEAVKYASEKTRKEREKAIRFFDI